MKNEMNIDNQLKIIFEDIYQSIAFDIACDDSNGISRDELFSTCCDMFETYASNYFYADELIDAIEYWRELSSEERASYKTIVFKFDSYEAGIMC